MKLPNRENAYIPPSKIRDYLLSDTHPVGRWKSIFFRTHGFSEMSMGELEQQLMEIAYSENVNDVVSSPYGTKYIIDGTLKTPFGRLLQIRTVWIIDAGQDHPRFVTVYPL